MTAANGAADRKRDDLVAGLAAVEARLDAVDRKLVEGFDGIEKLLDAKLTPVIQASAEQQRVVMDHERRLTYMETTLEKEVAPAASEVWKVKRDVQALQGHANRCDERAKQQGARSWALIMAWVSPVATGIVVWLLTRLGVGTGR